MDDYRADIRQLEENVLFPVRRGLRNEIKKFCDKLGISERELFSGCNITTREHNNAIVVSIYYNNSYLKIYSYVDSLRINISTYIGAN